MAHDLAYSMHSGGLGMVPTDWDIYIQFLKMHLLLNHRIAIQGMRSGSALVPPVTRLTWKWPYRLANCRIPNNRFEFVDKKGSW